MIFDTENSHCNLGFLFNEGNVCVHARACEHYSLLSLPQEREKYWEVAVSSNARCILAMEGKAIHKEMTGSKDIHQI